MASLFFNKGKLTLLFVFSNDDSIVRPEPLAYRVYLYFDGLQHILIQKYGTAHCVL